jgi:Bacterial Ig-like domain (group 3)
LLTVGTRSASVSLSCVSVFTVNKPIKCTVTVANVSPGTPLTPAGSVTFASNHPGRFSSTACSLSENNDVSSCSVTFMPTRVAIYTLTAKYGGDSDFGGGQASQKFRVA